MAGRYILLVLVASLAPIPRIADAQNRQTDEISKLLFETYLAGPRKINSSTIRAATHIVAERGRVSGFWKQVLAELKTDDEHSEVACVRILGKMLAMDASARDAIRRQKETGEISAMRQAVYLGPEVIAELVERGRKADRLRVDHYAIALARARVPEASDFFKSILRARKPENGRNAPTGPYHEASTRFHAAVGLAQLGHPSGIDWLVAHSQFGPKNVWHAWPRGANSTDLNTCCVVALRQLSGERNLTTQAEWEAWSKTVDKTALASRAVDLVES